MTGTTGTSLLAVHTEGGLISPDIIVALSQPGADLSGLRPEDYHLDGERLSEAITKSWNRMRGEWTKFQDTRSRTIEGDPATGLTRERIMLPLFQELGYGRLVPARGLEAGGKSYSISHLWNRTPIHLVGFGVDLDRKKSGVAGAAQASPHGLVQELLNRSDDYLWGMVSNGLHLRILRDNRSLTRQAYVELDLEAIFSGELYPDFVVLWLLCHQSRVEAERPEECWLERWSSLGWEQGARALESLREGVQQAIESLGRGILSHHSNGKLRERLKSGSLSTQDLYRELLRLVYRLLFLFVAEDRDVLHSPGTPPEAIAAFRNFYSTHRLRMMAEQIRGSAYADLFAGLKTVMRLLGTLGAPELGLSALGSYLWSDDAIEVILPCDISNHDLLQAVRALGFTQKEKILWRVDYRNLGSEELGSVYESLLELHPVINVEAGVFTLDVAAGHERKTTGSYYTPHSLVQCLLDSALDPVLNEAASSSNPEQAILNLKVCDPATGSGHFLIAAAHRMARRLASVRTGDEEPSPEAMHHALRDVIGRCLYGVDVNPMAVELCKVSLWMEALEPGKPLSFLESHIQCGNSLLGTTPALLDAGIPDEAFGVLTGDEKGVATQDRKRNREERSGQLSLVDKAGGLWGENLPMSEGMKLASISDSTMEGIRQLESGYRDMMESAEYQRLKAACDAWCSAFVWPRKKDLQLPAMTQGLLNRIRMDPGSVPASVSEEVRRIAERNRFLHWHLTFAEVFGTERAGFDVVLGNPPWDQLQFSEKEWFAERRPEIGHAAGSNRKKLIEALATEDAGLYGEYLEALRHGEGTSALLSETGRYPLCGRGKINLYAVFAELAHWLMCPRGSVGIIVPTGIATDDTTKLFFASLVSKGILQSLYSFENEDKVFPAVHHSFRFCLMTLSGQPRSGEAQFAFFLRNAAQIADPERRFSLTEEDLFLLNPNSRTCPIFRTQRDAEIVRAIYRRVPVLIKQGPEEENPWGMSFRQGLFNMTSDSGLFRVRKDLEGDGFELDGNSFRKGRVAYLPLYEAKMIHILDHRFGTYEGQSQAQANQGNLPYLTEQQHADPRFLPMSRYWVPQEEVESRLANHWHRGWFLGWRDITNAVVLRTVIASVIPRVGVGHSLPLMIVKPVASVCSMLVANLSVFALDYVARQKVGGTHLTFFVYQQLPVLPPSTYDGCCPWDPGVSLKDWILPRVLELTYTAEDLRPFAVDCGFSGPPFRWDDERRFRLRCDLDAAFFLLYGISRNDVDYIMDTFPIVRRHDEEKYGEFRTKKAVLAELGRMQATLAHANGN